MAMMAFGVLVVAMCGFGAGSSGANDGIEDLLASTPRLRACVAELMLSAGLDEMKPGEFVIEAIERHQASTSRIEVLRVDGHHSDLRGGGPCYWTAFIVSEGGELRADAITLFTSPFRDVARQVAVAEEKLPYDSERLKRLGELIDRNTALRGSVSLDAREQREKEAAFGTERGMVPHPAWDGSESAFNPGQTLVLTASMQHLAPGCRTERDYVSLKRAIREGNGRRLAELMAEERVFAFARPVRVRILAKPRTTEGGRLVEVEVLEGTQAGTVLLCPVDCLRVYIRASEAEIVATVARRAARRSGGTVRQAARGTSRPTRMMGGAAMRR